MKTPDSPEDAEEMPFQLPDASFGEGGLVERLDETDWERIRDLSYEGLVDERG